jgi:hypothetical protein
MNRPARGITSALALVILLACFYADVAAGPLDPAQKAALLAIRAELPSLETLTERAWTDAAIDEACNTYSIYGVTLCNTSGWIEELSMPDNFLIGPMPNALGQMLGLKFLVVDGAFSGQMVPSLGNLVNLEKIRLYNCPQLQGPIPDSWKALKALKEFEWVTSNFPSPIPDWIGQEWPLLERFTWSNIYTSGEFPSTLLTLPLKLLNINRNALYGSIPDAVASMATLEELIMDENVFNLTLPSDWSGTPALRILEACYNNFIGQLPQIYPDSLERFGACESLFEGSIPQALLDLPALTSLYLHNNRLTGTLPWPSTPSNSHLQIYEVYYNFDLQGSIPSSFWEMSELTNFIFTNTLINGSLPQNVSPGCTLRRLSGEGAKLTGSLPPRLDYCQSLTLFDLTANHLSGSLPFNIFLLRQLNTLRLGDNDFSGPLPQDWSELRNLAHLDLSYNRLSGPVFQGLTNLTLHGSLNFLSLKGNELDLCGDPRIVLESIRAGMTCDMTEQDPHPCGCPGVWDRCLETNVNATCIPTSPSPSPSPSPTEPSACSPTTPTGPSSPSPSSSPSTQPSEQSQPDSSPWSLQPSSSEPSCTCPCNPSDGPPTGSNTPTGDISLVVPAFAFMIFSSLFILLI